MIIYYVYMFHDIIIYILQERKYTMENGNGAVPV